MVRIEKIETNDKAQVSQFIQLPFRLYANCPQWVPPFSSDVRMMLNRDKHPFYERSDAEFFIAIKDGEVVARLAVMEHKPFNAYHHTRKAAFTLFECINDQEVADLLFARAFEWARERGLNEIVGPKGLCSFDGYGILVQGFEHRQMMTMVSYNYEYYPVLLENIGFEKEVDFVSCYLPAENFNLPEKVKEVARRVTRRGRFEVLNFSNKRQLKALAGKIGEAYNKAFVNNWEYYPLSDGEIKYLLDTLLQVINPRLVKLITYKEDMVGFLLAFPDISAALQRQKGKITPWGVFDLLGEMKRADWVSLNGAGILPQYHGLGGNALLYAEMQKSILDFRFKHAELTQVAETAVQMRKDLINVGGQEYKNHRVYHRAI